MTKFRHVFIDAKRPSEEKGKPSTKRPKTNAVVKYFIDLDLARDSYMKNASQNQFTQSVTQAVKDLFGKGDKRYVYNVYHRNGCIQTDPVLDEFGLGKLAPYQEFHSLYMSPTNPNQSLYIDAPVGSGKTISYMAIISNFFQYERDLHQKSGVTTVSDKERLQVFYVTRSNLTNDIDKARWVLSNPSDFVRIKALSYLQMKNALTGGNKELGRKIGTVMSSVTVSNEGYTNVDTRGSSRVKKVPRSDVSNTKPRRFDDVNLNRTPKKLTGLAYREKNGKGSNDWYRESNDPFLTNTLFIIDEAHHLFEDDSQFGALFSKVLQDCYVSNPNKQWPRVIVGSATPAGSGISNFMNTLNMLNTYTRKIPGFIPKDISNWFDGGDLTVDAKIRIDILSYGLLSYVNVSKDEDHFPRVEIHNELCIPNSEEIYQHMREKLGQRFAYSDIPVKEGKSSSSVQSIRPLNRQERALFKQDNKKWDIRDEKEDAANRDEEFIEYITTYNDEEQQSDSSDQIFHINENLTGDSLRKAVRYFMYQMRRLENCLASKFVGDTFRLGNSIFDAGDVLNMIENEFCPKIEKLLENIHAIDKKDTENGEKPRRHLIISNTRNLFGANLIAAALFSCGYRWQTFKRDGTGVSEGNVKTVDVDQQTKVPDNWKPYPQNNPAKFVVLSSSLLDEQQETGRARFSTVFRDKNERVNIREDITTNDDYVFVGHSTAQKIMDDEIPTDPSKTGYNSNYREKKSEWIANYREEYAGKRLNLITVKKIRNGRADEEDTYLHIGSRYDPKEKIAVLESGTLEIRRKFSPILTTVKMSINSLKEKGLIRWRPRINQLQRSSMITNVINKFNSLKENTSGEFARILILSDDFREGIDVFRCNYIHLMDEFLSREDEIQTMGRGLRRCGHVGLDYKDWTVDVYRYFLGNMVLPIDYDPKGTKDVEITLPNNVKINGKVYNIVINALMKQYGKGFPWISFIRVLNASIKDPSETYSDAIMKYIETNSFDKEFTKVIEQPEVDTNYIVTKTGRRISRRDNSTLVIKVGKNSQDKDITESRKLIGLSDPVVRAVSLYDLWSEGVIIYKTPKKLLKSDIGFILDPEHERIERHLMSIVTELLDILLSQSANMSIEVPHTKETLNDLPGEMNNGKNFKEFMERLNRQGIYNQWNVIELLIRFKQHELQKGLLEYLVKVVRHHIANNTTRGIVKKIIDNITKYPNNTTMDILRLASKFGGFSVVNFLVEQCLLFGYLIKERAITNVTPEPVVDILGLDKLLPKKGKSAYKIKSGADFNNYLHDFRSDGNLLLHFHFNMKNGDEIFTKVIDKWEKLLAINTSLDNDKKLFITALHNSFMHSNGKIDNEFHGSVNDNTENNPFNTIVKNISRIGCGIVDQHQIELLYTGDIGELVADILEKPDAPSKYKDLITNDTPAKKIGELIEMGKIDPGEIENETRSIPTGMKIGDNEFGWNKSSETFNTEEMKKDVGDVFELWEKNEAFHLGEMNQDFLNLLKTSDVLREGFISKIFSHVSKKIKGNLNSDDFVGNTFEKYKKLFDNFTIFKKHVKDIKTVAGKILTADFPTGIQLLQMISFKLELELDKDFRSYLEKLKTVLEPVEIIIAISEYVENNNKTMPLILSEQFKRNHPFLETFNDKFIKVINLIDEDRRDSAKTGKIKPRAFGNAFLTRFPLHDLKKMEPALIMSNVYLVATDERLYTQ